LIYVWAIEQDGLSKRNIPTSTKADDGQDVFVPWVLPIQASLSSPKVRTRNKMGVTTVGDHNEEEPRKQEARVFNRYYHMFAKGELRRLVCEAADELELSVGIKSDTTYFRGITVVQEGWERSNYYVEIRTWKR
jgi:tRNA (uracil-5-)-methyltransferase TRM9